jgi:hypothetical protein
MNPSGAWRLANCSLYVFECEGYAVYGKVSLAGLGGKQTYWWEARVRLDSRDGTQPISGYAPTLSQAQHIVETLLWETDTVRK